MDKYICTVCATIYNPEEGDLEDRIPKGTPFENLPDNWTCPVCGSSKLKFRLLPESEYQKIINKEF